MTTITDVRTVAVAVAVRDQDSALAFYTDKLGFEKRLDAPISDEIRWVEVAPTGAAVSIALTAAEPAATGAESTHDTATAGGHDTGVRFTVPDAAAEHAWLRERGVSVGDLLQWPGVPPMFEFDDPDGNHFYVVEADG